MQPTTESRIWRSEPRFPVNPADPAQLRAEAEQMRDQCFRDYQAIRAEWPRREGWAEAMRVLARELSQWQALCARLAGGSTR